MGCERKILILSLCGMLLLAASCAPRRLPAAEEVTSTALDEVYAHARRQGITEAEQSLREDLQMQGTLGYVRPYVPVRTPPNVMRVWIPPFEDEQHNLVQGHWVHVVVHDEGWYVGQQASPADAMLPHAVPSRGTAAGKLATMEGQP